jgi:hypothetical protein
MLAPCRIAHGRHPFGEDPPRSSRGRRGMKMFLSTAMVVLMNAGSGPAIGRAESPPPSCEPSKLNTQDASPLGEGAWQVQLNGAYDFSTKRWSPSWKKERRHRSYEWNHRFVLTRGISNELDLAVGSGYSWMGDDETAPRSGHGFADLALSAKWRFFKNEKRRLAIAYVPTLTVPTGSTSSPDRLGPSQEFWSLDTRFAVVRDWSRHWSTNFDIGYNAVFNRPGDSGGSLGANLAVGYQLLLQLQPELEFNCSHDFLRGKQDANLVAVTAGVVMPLSELVCLRAGAQRGIAGHNADLSTTILLSVDLNF